MSNRDIKPMVFYFAFDLSYHTDEERSVVKAFVVNKTGMEKVLATHKIAADADFASSGDTRCTAFNYFTENDYVEVTEEVEAIYGVHDWYTNPSDDVDAIGYGSYEVKPSKIDNVMKKHRAYFVKHAGKANVSQIVEISISESDNDSDVYQKAIAAIAAEESLDITGKDCS